MRHSSVAHFQHARGPRKLLVFIEDFGAGEGNRTLVISLEGCCSTIELHPHRRARPIGLVGEVGLEPTKASASGFTVRPLCRSGHSPVTAGRNSSTIERKAPPRGRGSVPPLW